MGERNHQKEEERTEEQMEWLNRNFDALKSCNSLVEESGLFAEMYKKNEYPKEQDKT